MPEEITREVMTQVRILHEDVIARLKIIHEGQSPKPRAGSAAANSIVQATS